MSEFDSEKDALLSDLQASRAKLHDVVAGLSSDDLSSARPGSWPVSKILDHVVHSERLYAQLISVFSGVGTSSRAALLRHQLRRWPPSKSREKRSSMASAT